MGEPKRIGRTLTGHQRNAIAQGLAAGLSPNQIAPGASCTPSVIEDLIRHDPALLKKRDAYASRSLSRVAHSKLGMGDLLPKADRIVEAGMDGEQPFPIQLQTAMYVRSQAIPKATQHHEHEHEHHHAHEMNPEVEGAMVSIAKTLSSLRQRHDPDAILQRAVREGPDALPTPAEGVALLPAETESPAPADEDSDGDA